MTNPPSKITYSTVVTRDSVRIAFLVAALNDVDILATNIGNAYLNANPIEKVHTTAGPEFGAELKGKYVLIVKALYGLKSSGAAWRAHFANTLKDLGFTSCLADPDIWFRAAKKPDGYAKPKQYLGECIFQDESNKIRWALSSEQHVKKAIKNIEKHLATENRSLRKSNQPMPTSYLPELDITTLLEDDEIHFFQSQISILR